MSSILTARLAAAFALTEGLAEVMTDDSLALHNGSAPSNSIDGQFWCVVGARESYARAIAAGTWSGFSCSLSASDAQRADKVRAALERSRTNVLDAISGCEPTDHRDTIAFSLLEHETLHHGQLVRYFYANGIRFPEAFAERYALAQPTASDRVKRPPA
jgi:hypothetical protein